MNNIANITALDSELNTYIRQISAFPMLEAEEEKSLALKLRDHNDLKAAEKLVASHLRLVVKIAHSYKNYGLSMMDMISEGNIGLLKAVKKFDIDKGFRLSTYAIWWIKAQIQEYILNSWSLVKIGTSATKKKLFFNLNKVKNKLLNYEQNTLDYQQINEAAKELGVDKSDIVEMSSRLSQGDVYLYDQINDEDDNYMIDKIADNQESQEIILANSQEEEQHLTLLNKALNNLNDREKEIFQARKLTEPAKTLEELSQKFKISKERVRQIEVAAFTKIQKFCHSN